MKDDINTLDNSRLTLLIERWAKANESRRSYDHVIGELYNGKAFLIFETTTQPNANGTFEKNEVAQFAMPYYTVDEVKYFVAFTGDSLYNEWMEGIPSYKVKMSAKMLLEAIDKSGLGGIIINTNDTNVFVAFFQTNT